MDNKKRSFESRSIFRGGDLRISPSEMALFELFASEDYQKIQGSADQILGGSESYKNGVFGVESGDRKRLPLDSSENHKKISGSNSLSDNTSIWSQNLYAKLSSFSLPMDSQSSICAGSPLSANISKERDNLAVEDSTDEQSDDDFDLETEAGSCDQSKSPIDIKRFKRMVSNRESARRSRRRKQAHLADLERQAEELRGENAGLFKQLADATQRFKDSTTNNRVLRSDVEALRAKVKLAEDMISRGSLTSSLSNLLQNYLNIPQDYMNSTSSVGHIVPPIMAPHIGDNNEISGSTIGMQNVEPFNNVPNGVMVERSNWESHIK